MTDVSPLARGARPPARRRAPWVLLPALLGLLYAAGWALLRRRPSLEGMVPPDAFVTWWYRDLHAYDAARTGPPSPDGAPLAPPSLVLGAELNLPNLPGVDRGRPLVEAWLDPARRVDPRFWVLPLEDERAAMRTFRDPDLAERHARHVVPHGDWAAVAWDLDAARKAGRGFGLLAAPSPSDPDPVLWSVTADWPRLVDYVLQPHVASTKPWQGILAALGFDPSSAVRVETPEGPQFEVKAGRVPLVRDGWRRATLHVLGPAGAEGDASARPTGVRLVLEPGASSELRPALAEALRGSEAAPLPPSVLAEGGGLEWEARLASGPARAALVRALAYAGLAWPEAAARDDFAALRTDRPGGLVVGAQASMGLLPAWTLVLAGPADALPDPAAFGLPDAPTGGKVPLPEGVAPVTVPFGGRAPPSEVARAAAADGRAILAFGIGAETVAQQAARAAATAAGGAPAARKDGRAVLCELRVRGTVVDRLLGPAVEPGGLLAALAGAETVTVVVATDGERLVVEARR